MSREPDWYQAIIRSGQRHLVVTYDDPPGLRLEPGEEIVKCIGLLYCPCPGGAMNNDFWDWVSYPSMKDRREWEKEHPDINLEDGGQR